MVFSALGGMYGVVVTDTLMFFTMLAVSIVISPWIIAEAGFDGMKSLSDTLPGFWSIGGTENHPLSFSISQFIVWVIFMTCSPAIVSRVFPAKNDLVVLKAAGIGVFLGAFMQIPVFLAAGAMQSIEPGIEPADQVMVVAFLDHVPGVLGGIGLAALMAAIMSTASTLFVLAGFGLSRDLYENLKRDGISERHRMIVSRAAQLLIGLVVAAIAIARPAAIYWISVYAAAIFGVGWLPTVVAGLEWKRMNRYAALSSMCIGVSTFIVLTELVRLEVIILPVFLDPLMTSFFAAIVALVTVGLLTQPSEEEMRYFRQIKSSSASAKTIAAILAKPDGLAELKREHRRVQVIMAVLVVLALTSYGFMTLKLAF
jgi:sodium/pantothenate symporter